MENKKLCIKLIKDELQNSIEAVKAKEGREPTQDELHTMVYQTCRQLITLDGVSINFELYLKDIEELDKEYYKQFSTYLEKRKKIIEEMLEDIMKL